MADFASVFQLANRPTVQLESPMESMAKALQLKNAMQQGEIQGLNLQQQRMSMADALAFRQGLREVDPNDPAAVGQLLTRTGKFKEAAEYAKAQKDAEAAKVGLQTEYLKLDKSTQEAMKGSLQAIGNSAHTVAQIKDPMQRVQAWQQQLGTLQAQFQPQPTDSPQLQGIKKRMFDGLSREAQSLSGPVDPSVVDGLLSKHFNDAKTHEDWIKEAELGKFTGFHAGADQTAYQVNPQGQARQIIGPDGKPLKVPPPMSTMIMAQGGGGGNPSAPLPDMGMEAVAQAIARGDQAPQEYSIRNPAGKIINARAAAIAAESGNTIAGKSQVAARASSLKDFETGGKSGQTINALNTMTEHLATARRMAEALQNGDIQAFNKLRQAFQTQTGQPAPTDFATIKQFLAGEVAKVATGGHITEGEIHAASDRLNQAQSPAQLMGALDTMREVAGGKLVALNQDYKRLKGKSLAEDGRLTPATRQAFEKANAHINPGSGEAKAPKQLTPAELGKLPPAIAKAYLEGKTIQGPDGTSYKKGK